jgi:hypothetical protein
LLCNQHARQHIENVQAKTNSFQAEAFGRKVQQLSLLSVRNAECFVAIATIINSSLFQKPQLRLSTALTLKSRCKFSTTAVK